MALKVWRLRGPALQLTDLGCVLPPWLADWVTLGWWLRSVSPSPSRGSKGYCACSHMAQGWAEWWLSIWHLLTIKMLIMLIWELITILILKQTRQIINANKVIRALSIYKWPDLFSLDPLKDLKLPIFIIINNEIIYQIIIGISRPFGFQGNRIMGFHEPESYNIALSHIAL